MLLIYLVSRPGSLQVFSARSKIYQLMRLQSLFQYWRLFLLKYAQTQLPRRFLFRCQPNLGKFSERFPCYLFTFLCDGMSLHLKTITVLVFVSIHFIFYFQQHLLAHFRSCYQVRLFNFLYCLTLNLKLAATPPNAIAYGSGKITVLDMIKSGVVANLIGILVVNAMLNSWGVYYFDLNSQDFKNWTDTRYC